MSKPRILAIRGGAIGDFILTLPAIRQLRETFGHCHLEILGYRHIAELALRGGPRPGTTYADAVRSMEYGPMAAFFARGGSLAPDLCQYFASFQQVVSWLFDPDGIFEANMERAGVRQFVNAYTKLNDEDHAARQLARPLERLALYLEDHAAALHPGSEDQQSAAAWLKEHRVAGVTGPLVALHPGSGSPRKNWPVDRWLAVAQTLSARGAQPLLIGGEADGAQLDTLQRELGGKAVAARALPLPQLAALLTHCQHYVGHDTGISHLATAVGTPATLLFGPTDPSVWAPVGEKVQVVRPGTGDLSHLPVDEVMRVLPQL